MEYIGNVKIDDTLYCGNDLYSDGKVEDELLDIVKNNSNKDFPKIILDKKKWALLYHLSDIRENIINWLPEYKNQTVLEIGSGCGAITGSLSKKFKNVTCIELSKKRSLINAYKNKQCDNVKILLGNYKEVSNSLTEKYDFITLIGVFEYADAYMNSENPYEDFLISIKQHLKPNGKLIIAIENKLGLKYWAGCIEDHKGIYFEGIEDYITTTGVKTFTKHGMEEICKTTGFSIDNCYYPYPDYKLPLSIYSDEYLPSVGELNNNYNNFDSIRIKTFDESKVFDTVIRENKFSDYSNSYLFILKEDK